MRPAFRKGFIGLVLCLSLLILGLVNAEACFNRIVTFGDSLSDPGNYFLLTGDFEVRPFTEPIPDSPYAIGGFHFSNGRTWIERLATDLNMPRSGKPALLLSRVFTNYAVGRSQARPPDPPETATCKLCDLTSQVTRFLKDFHHKASSGDLYVVFIGANDLRDALVAYPSPDFWKIIVDATSATKQNITTLYDAGARTFLVPNLPNIGITPAVRALGPDAQVLAEFLSSQYNLLLEANLEQLANDPSYPGMQIIRLDVFGALETLVESPESAGFSVVDLPCLNFGVVKGAICGHPNRYLFWDGVHPTAAGHDYLSEKAKEALEKDLNTP